MNAYHARGRSRGFTLIEVLVVISVIALLIAILLPIFGRARGMARTAQCASGMRQWGIALGAYLVDFKGRLPDEGRVRLNRLGGTWYNELPLYADARRYRDLYDGQQSLGEAGGYSDSWIWYCPERVLRRKNSGSGLNAFHYAMNAVLNGHRHDDFGNVLNFLPDYGSDQHRFHTALEIVDHPSHTVFLAEVFNNIPEAFPNAPSGFPGNLEWDRHQEKNGNLLFLDGHVTLHNTTRNDPSSANVIETLSSPYARTSPDVFWGVFP